MTVCESDPIGVSKEGIVWLADSTGETAGTIFSAGGPSRAFPGPEICGNGGGRC